MATDARMPSFSAACSAMLMASVVLPIDGRPAMISRSPPRNPPVFVEIDEARGQAARLIGVVVQVVDLSISAGSACRALTYPLPREPFGDREDSPLGLSTRSRALSPSSAPHRARDLAARADQLAQQRALLDDLRVGTHVGGARRVARQRAEIGKPAGIVELAEALQVFGDRHRIAGLASAASAAMLSKISAWSGRKKSSATTTSPTLSQARAIEHQTAEHRLLRFLGMRRRAQIGGTR